MYDGTRPLPLATRFCLWLLAGLALAFLFTLTDAARWLRGGCVRCHGGSR